MSTEKKLDCVILGLLSHEPLTGYEIKKRIDGSLKYFWGASYGSIYPTLSSLVDQGLATRKSDTDSKRNKQVYTITDAGKQYLKKWLQIPVEKDILRYETLLKLFFGNEAGPQQTLSHIRAFQQKTEKELSYLLGTAEILKKCPKEDKTHLYYLLTVDFGIRSYQAYLTWCENAIAVLEEE